MYINNIPCELQNNTYYIDERSLTRVNSFADNITDQNNVKLPNVITYRECKIMYYIYQTYHMMQLISDYSCTFPAKDG